jgi:hypothetical protein
MSGSATFIQLQTTRPRPLPPAGGRTTGASIQLRSEAASTPSTTTSRSQSKAAVSPVSRAAVTLPASTRTRLEMPRGLSW